MGFVSLQDLQGNIELILFAKTWDQFRELIEVDKVLLAEGTVDAQGNDPKILVDRIRTEFTYLDALDETLQQSQKPGSVRTESRPASASSPPRRESTPTRPDTRPAIGQAARISSPPSPVRHIAESQPEYETSDNEWDPSVPMPDFPIWDEDFTASTTASPNFQIAEPVPLYMAPSASDSSSGPPSSSESEPGNSQVTISSAQYSTPNIQYQSLIANRLDALQSRPPVPSYLLTPRPGEDPEIPRRMVTITLRANHDKVRDALKIQRIYGVFVSYPGDDRFALYLFEGNRSFLIEFPNFTTQISDEMLQRLYEFVPREGVRIEPIIYQ
jgi:DNA polymerase-3 subunit alpha